MWLGASLLSIFQVIDFMIARCFHSCCHSTCSSVRTEAANNSKYPPPDEIIETEPSISPDESVVAIHYHKAVNKSWKKIATTFSLLPHYQSSASRQVKHQNSCIAKNIIHFFIGVIPCSYIVNTNSLHC